jgi:Tfp pilus assembly protein PilO
MKRNLILSIILLVYIIGFWAFYKNILTQQPSTIKDLETQISEKKRQLLSAQIISKNLQNVNELIQNNLINSPNDSLAMPANMAFLQYLTSLMDRFNIILLSIRPMDVLKSDQQNKDQWATSSGAAASDSLAKEYIEIPYSMTVLASYIQIGQFIQELEKSPRLIRIVRFQMENPLDVSFYEDEVSGKPDQHRVNLDIHTLTILKASFKGGQEQFN